MRLGWLFAICWLCIGVAQAEDGVWQSNVELGFVQTGGNTQTQTLHSKAKSVRNDDVIRTTLEGSALNSSDKKTTTSEKYSASLQEDWKFSEKDYLIGRLSYSADRFAGIKSRYTESIGYGRDLIAHETLKWNGEIGAGMQQSTLIPSKHTNDPIARAATALKWDIQKGSIFSQVFNTEGSGKNGFVSHSITSLQQKISGALSSKFSFSAEHTSKVATGIKKINTETSITLVWAY